MLVDDRLLACGIIGAPFGVAGAMHFYPSSGQCDHLLGVREFFFKKDNQYELARVQLIRRHQDHLILHLDAINDRDLAQKLVHQHLYVDIQHLPACEDGQFYWYQLTGLTVLNLQGQDLGQVTELYSNGPQDVLTTSQGHHIPFLKDHIVKTVSLNDGIITVDFLPEYFVDTNA
jgi:16S rRNA processing protein RimM